MWQLLGFGLVIVAAACRPRAPSPPARGMIAGLIRDAASGTGVTGAIIVLRRPGEIAPTRDRSDANGAFMIPDLAPGRYQITAYVANTQIGEREAEVRASEVIGVDFTIGPGAHPAPDLNAPGAPTLWRFRRPDADPARGVIEGTVADILRHQRLSGAVVSLTVSGTTETVQTLTDEQGRFTVPNLRPATYEISAYYTVIRRGQLEVRRSRVDLAGGETVVVPLWLETDDR